MKHSIQVLGWLGSACALACGAAAPADAGDPSVDEAVIEAPGAPSAEPAEGVIYSATLDDGSTLEIRQRGGIVLLSGTTPEGVEPLAERYDLSMPITELVQQIFPEREVPEALFQAQREEEEHWRNQPDTEDQPSGVSSDDRSGLVGEASAVISKDAFHGSFEATNCSTNRLTHQPITSLRHLNWCNLHWTGGFHSGTFNNVRQGYGAVQVYGGSVTFRRSWRATGASSFTVDNWTVGNTGSAMWAEAHSGSNATGVDVFFEVLNAAGDSFHASGMWADRLSCFSQGFVCATGCLVQIFKCNDGSTQFSSCLSTC